MAPEGEQFMEIRCKNGNGSRKCEFRDERLKCCNIVDQWRPLKKTIVTNALKKNDSTVVAAEDMVCKREKN